MHLHDVFGSWTVRQALGTVQMHSVRCPFNVRIVRLDLPMLMGRKLLRNRQTRHCAAIEHPWHALLLKFAFTLLLVRLMASQMWG